MGRMWTEDQLHAIEARGGSVLVSAAAGSGKTAVLVERLIRRITDRQNPVDADRFLVVTFTKAAAAEMRERVAARLRELLRENPADGFLQHQMLLLERAQICTIDSFFGSVVRENFEQLGVSPSLRVADETLLGRLRDEVLEDLLEQQYGLKEENFIRLVRYFGEENDNRLKAEMLKLYDKIRSLPFPFQWMEEQLIRYQSVAPVEETAWGRQLMQKVSQGVSYCQQVAKRALSVLEADEGLLSAYAPACLSDLGQLEKLSGACEAGQWDGIYEALKEFSFEKLSRAPKDSDPTVKEQFNALRDMVKDEVKGFCKRIPCRNADYLADLQAQAPLVEALFDLTKKFYQALDAEKQELNIGDFNDFAYLTLQLVSDEDGNPTSFAEEFSAQFEEILLDEYQDTNRLQDLIFRCISRDGENLFLVGDLKQSIYRFRNADPAVFMEKKEAFFPYDGVHYPAFISLSKNFRSRAGVTSGVNAVFEKLMTRELGNVTYDEQERLNCGAIYPDVPGLPPETALQLIHVNKEETDEHRLVIEARETARQIGKMLRDGMPVTENGVLRPCRGGDFVILLRSARDTDAIFAAALKEEGVDAVLGASSGYFTSREVSVMVSLLKVLDNPMLDIPMAAVLLSPMFSFSCDELGALLALPPGEKPLRLSAIGSGSGQAESPRLYPHLPPAAGKKRCNGPPKAHSVHLRHHRFYRSHVQLRRAFRAGGQPEAALKIRPRLRGGRQRGIKRLCLLHRLPHGKRKGLRGGKSCKRGGSVGADYDHPQIEGTGIPCCHRGQLLQKAQCNGLKRRCGHGYRTGTGTQVHRQG